MIFFSFCNIIFAKRVVPTRCKVKFMNRILAAHSTDLLAVRSLKRSESGVTVCDSKVSPKGSDVLRPLPSLLQCVLLWVSIDEQGTGENIGSFVRI